MRYVRLLVGLTTALLAACGSPPVTPVSLATATPTPHVIVQEVIKKVIIPPTPNMVERTLSPTPPPSPGGQSTADQSTGLNPQLVACLRGVLAPEAFSAIYVIGSRRESVAESRMVSGCYSAQDSGGSGRQQEAPQEDHPPAGQSASQGSEGQQGPHQQQPDTNGPTAIKSVYGTDLTNCSNTIKSFDSPPVPLEMLVHIEPMGNMGGRSGHITPTDHLYINVISTGSKSVPVLAIADGYLVKLKRRADREGQPDWRAVIEHSCSLFSWYIHWDTPSEAILKQVTLDSSGTWFGRIPVQSGDPVGYVGEPLSHQQASTDDFDWAVSDTNTLLKGFIIADRYQAEPWKIHLVDPFDYYDDPLKSALIKKSLRTLEPHGGKIDYDVDGRLVGNWFLEGTRDYAATGLVGTDESDWPMIFGRDAGECTRPYWDKELKRETGNIPCAYWLGHAVFSYHHIEPRKVMISLGLHYDREGGTETPWAVLGNGPDPANVSVDTGEVKYILIDRKTPLGGDARPIGTLLVKMLDERSIKTELFFGVGASMVNGFTERAKIYRR